MMHVVLFILSLAGFAALFLAMARHQQDWLNSKLARPVSKALRGVGFGLLGLGFFRAGAGFGWAYGTVCWLGWMSLAAGLIVAVNINRESLLRAGRR